MSQKKKTAGKTAKKPTFFNTETRKTMTQEEFIKGAAEGVIKDIQLTAQEYNITVEEILMNKEALGDYVVKMVSDFVKREFPLKILEEVLNKAFRDLNSNTKVVLTAAKSAA
jgi:hypothetical protein